jgi:hypothetical protein
MTYINLLFILLVSMTKESTPVNMEVVDRQPGHREGEFRLERTNDANRQWQYKQDTNAL